VAIDQGERLRLGHWRLSGGRRAAHCAGEHYTI
jgi:hypothetical protein